MPVMRKGMGKASSPGLSASEYYICVRNQNIIYVRNMRTIIWKYDKSNGARAIVYL